MNFAFEEACLVAFLFHYLDDFISLAEASRREEAMRDFHTVVALAQHIGIPLAGSKLRPPSTETVFLGVTINTVDMTVSIPQEKRTRYLEVVSATLEHKKATKKALLSVAGKLMWVGRVLRPGRAFIRRIIDKAHSVREDRFLVSLDAGVREDLTWWKDTLQAWIGTTLITYREWRFLPDFHAQSDASGSGGFGLICGRDWCVEQWSEEARGLNIAVLEMIPLVVGAVLWGQRWSRKRVLFETDNAAVVACAKSWLPRDDHLTRLFRRLASLAIRHDFDLKVVHLAGKLNTDADDLSRGRTTEFLSRNPHVHSSPTVIPVGLVASLTEVDF